MSGPIHVDGSACDCIECRVTFDDEAALVEAWDDVQAGTGQRFRGLRGGPRPTAAQRLLAAARLALDIAYNATSGEDREAVALQLDAVADGIRVAAVLHRKGER